MSFDDDYNLKLLYQLADGRTYNPTSHWTCSNTFVESYPSVQTEFKPDGPLKQIGGGHS